MDMSNNFKMVAKTLFGFEELLSKELRNLHNNGYFVSNIS